MSQTVLIGLLLNAPVRDTRARIRERLAERAGIEEERGRPDVAAK